MTALSTWLERLLSTPASRDSALADEILAIRGSRSLSRTSSTRPLPAAERNIVLRVGRPVLAIVDDAAVLDFKDSQSAVWRSRLETSAPVLTRAAKAVGR